MAKVRAKDAKNVFTIYFKGKGTTPFKIGEGVTAFTHDNLIDISWLNVEYYDGMSENNHHITTRSYYDIILPFISLYMKNFTYNKNDFNLIPNWSDDKLFSIPYLYPKTDYKFTISINNVVFSEHGGYDTIINPHIKWKDKGGGCYGTEYHRIFRGAHACGKVVNETIDTDKKLFISCDSMAIPMIPIFACYYKEVVFMDNREGKISYSSYFGNTFFDDIIFCVSSCNKLEKFTEINLM